MLNVTCTGLTKTETSDNKFSPDIFQDLSEIFIDQQSSFFLIK